MPFSKRIIIYSKVANLREIIYAEIAIKRTGNAGYKYRLKGLEIIPEEELKLGDLGIGNGKMLVIGKFND